MDQTNHYSSVGILSRRQDSIIFVSGRGSVDIGVHEVDRLFRNQIAELGESLQTLCPVIAREIFRLCNGFTDPRNEVILNDISFAEP